jgi:acyl transferase domain-containing protein
LTIETPNRARELPGVNEGFAIVGYALRVPGAADAQEFWDVLRDGRDAVSEVPPDRWDVEEYYDPDPDAPGKIVSRRAGFIDDVTGFDAPFFGLSKRETMLIDPQHRLLLETAWQAVEHSGTAPSALANTKSGVFVGLGTHDYLGLISEELSPAEIEAYVAIGTSSAAGAGRISYGLGLQGPAVSVDTACSSSLVAVHQACQALRFGECDLALAGGVNVMLSAKTAMTFSHAHMLAPDGKCKTFDAAADGYVRGEGCGVVVIKRLEDAIRDRDRIRAVIRGSAINQDGASGGLTVPNGVAQQRVIAEALLRAGVAAADVGYLEAHGTGTSLGDPIEVQAAGAALGQGRDPGRPLLIGSVKTNIGHPVARAPDVAETPALSEPVAAHSLGPTRGAGRGRSPPLGARRAASDRRGQFVRVLRDERSRHHRGGACRGESAGAGGTRRRQTVQPAAAVGTKPGRLGRAGAGLRQLARRPPRDVVGRPVLHRRLQPIALRASGRSGGQFDGIRA